MSQISCIGCGGVFQDIAGPTHRYMASSPGCWACFGEVLAREYSDLQYYQVHTLTVDAYAIQHPGRPALQTIRSVALHAIRLCALFEEGVELRKANKIMHQAARDKDRFVWLTPPASMGALTIADVVSAPDVQAHARLVEQWARSAWAAWSVHHPTIRKWLAESWTV